MASHSNIPNQGFLIELNIATGAWILEMVWNTNFVRTYSPELAYLVVEQWVTFFPFLFFRMVT